MEQSCTRYATFIKNLAGAMDAAETEAALEQVFRNGYPDLLNQLAACLDGSPASTQSFKNFVTQQVISTVADVDLNNKTPMLGFEYDLSTPLNKPSYSTAKANFSLQFGKPPTTPTATPEGGAAKSATQIKTDTKAAANQKKQATWIAAVSKTVNTEGSAAPPQSTTVASATTKAAAATVTPTWTVNFMADGEFYNAQPASSIPSAQRLRDVQLGLEVDYVIRGSNAKSCALCTFIGDSTLSLSYLYQDQTSPSIVTAPPSGIAFSNLPSNASTVYTSRGPINLGQIRWGLGTGSNVSFPIAFTYSNRSDLIAHPIAGLQFGLSYNLSSLFSNNAGK
jgi:hypothetical protein